jgi:hypothetical protein
MGQSNPHLAHASNPDTVAAVFEHAKRKRADLTDAATRSDGLDFPDFVEVLIIHLGPSVQPQFKIDMLAHCTCSKFVAPRA